ncbi:unnamed protein product [Linum tenue]|uniref:Uncharacterized protein n=1 Tax=Linum tenue TaxID=586396 RepID=A0AAV0NMM4_9ROSI|nr:unnamed protein product [Linum tenue]
MAAEAKYCHKTWDCSTFDHCLDDCKSRYGGRGHCRTMHAPFIPKQCFCYHEC